jgi:hypothetical protein
MRADRYLRAGFSKAGTWHSVEQTVRSALDTQARGGGASNAIAIRVWHFDAQDRRPPAFHPVLLLPAEVNAGERLEQSEDVEQP